MKYVNIVEGTFVERPNRFVAEVDIRGHRHKAHVKNTGRCAELLLTGATVYLEDHQGRMGKRKLRFSLIGVRKQLSGGGELLINMDSQVPNKVVEEGLADGSIKLPIMGRLKTIKREKTWGDSRLDFYLQDEDGREAYAEVKGVTLEDNGIVKFPDAPTERGSKHIRELIKIKKDGMEAFIIFVVQMEKAVLFCPNNETDKRFAQNLQKAEKEGIGILAYTCLVTPDSIKINKSINIKI